MQSIGDKIITILSDGLKNKFFWQLFSDCHLFLNLQIVHIYYHAKNKVPNLKNDWAITILVYLTAVNRCTRCFQNICKFVFGLLLFHAKSQVPTFKNEWAMAILVLLKAILKTRQILITLSNFPRFGTLSFYYCDKNTFRAGDGQLINKI